MPLVYGYAILITYTMFWYNVVRWYDTATKESNLSNQGE